MNINKLMKHYKGMKKNCFYGRGVLFHLKKCLKDMKLCLFFMFVLHLGVSVSGYTQQKVSLSMADVTLEQILKELKQQTGLRFFYSVEKVRNEQKKVVTKCCKIINIYMDNSRMYRRSILASTNSIKYIFNISTWIGRSKSNGYI